MRIAAAREEVWIQMPYFVPGPRFCRLLESVLARGCRIHLMVPGSIIDWKLARRAARRTFARLLGAGMEICELPHRMMHQKVIVVDGKWCFVGSPNLDDRSLEINAEVGIGIWSEERAAELIEAFRRDSTSCVELDAETLAKRPAWSRALDSACYWLREQL
jgi:cardiolipin synthase